MNDPVSFKHFDYREDYAIDNGQQSGKEKAD